MKKALALVLFVAVFAGMCEDTRNKGEAYTHIAEVGTDPAVNYYGWARTTENTASTPSTNAAVWKIIKITTDSNGAVTEKKNAYGSGSGMNSLWSTAWTNRASATYK